MSQTSLFDEIQEINLAYLLLAQRLLSEDREAAMLRLKVDNELADLIIAMNARQLSRLARSNQLVCRFSQVTAAQLKQVMENPRDQGLSGLHASLLMASESFESLPRGERE
ncbi:flagellar transcriptional regulator FlhD [Halomonas sp. HNIBRBA4712]|uniref:flagellar transcriptional regulator FlhD n=1 Tax=Halomonas sp. HNIBRBA4712 TaxID=3373087 RepID=UPI0037477D83